MPSVEEGLRTQVRNIETRYGRPVDAWTELIRSSGLAKHGEIVAMLKSDHGMSHGDANRVALIALDAIRSTSADAAPPAADPIDALYAGSRAALRPIHDRVITVVTGFGTDVELSPKKGYVSLRRRKQFAMVGPAARHVDVGLILAGITATERLEWAGSFNAMFSHRVRVRSVDEVDAELEAWLRTAYDAA